jgi:RES domain-containing protein
MVPPLVEAIRHAIIHGEQRFETVLAPTVFAAIQDVPTTTPFVEILESKHAHVFVSEEDLSLRLTVVDDATVLVLTDDEGVLRAVIRSDDAAVCDWATTTFQSSRDAATLVVPDTFTP